MIVGYSPTQGLHVSAINWEYITIVVGLISLIVLLFIIWFSWFNFLQHKNTEQQYLVIIFSYQVQVLNRRLIWGSSWLLLLRLVYSWKYNSTLVTKFSLIQKPSCLWMITSPQAMELKLIQLLTSHQKAPQFRHTY